MRIRIISFFTALICCQLTNAQTISDCLGAIVLCGDLYTEDQAPLNTGELYEYTGECNLNTESNSVWYTFTVQQDGLLSFILTPNDLNDDYDWALFDITNGGCEGIYFGGPSPEVSCNSWGTLNPPNGPTGISTANGGTGNSNGPGDLNGPPFNADLPVLTGEVYALVVMNWSLSLEGYTIDFGESTASLYDDEPPSVISVEANCANTELTVVFSEDLVVSSVEGADFSITGPGGSYSVTDVLPQDGTGVTLDDTFIITIDSQITDPGTYNFTITNFSGLVEDLCGNLGEGTMDFPISPPMTYDVQTETACNGQGGSITITNISGGTEPFTFLLDGSVQGGFTASDLDEGTYTVEISDNANCDFAQEVIVPDNEISVIPPAADSVSCLHPVADLLGTTVIPDQSVSFMWTTIDGNIVAGANTQNPTVGAPGTYVVTVTNTTTGCTASTSVEVFSEEEVIFDATQLRFPNVVTPNGDSRNENWSPFLLNQPGYNVTDIFLEYKLRIFNRWGNMIFESTDSQRFWNASEAVQGNYYYTLSYVTNCGSGASGDIEGYIQVIYE